MITIPKLSFCITCKNRFHQIRETLPKNLADNRLFKDFVEFVVVDFGSNDGLSEWVLNNFKTELNEGYLAYYYTDELPIWHASVAKNTTHLLSSYNLLMNLDCDNYTGENGGKFVIRNFMRYGMDIILHQFSGNFCDGTFGRIGLTKHHFIQLGGYDESFLPMGFQDFDLLLRAQDYGLMNRQVFNSNFSKALINTKDESIKNCNSDFSYDEMNHKNSITSRQNRNKGKLIANNGLWGIRKNVFNHLGKEIKLKSCECNSTIICE